MRPAQYSTQEGSKSVCPIVSITAAHVSSDALCIRRVCVVAT